MNSKIQSSPSLLLCIALDCIGYASFSIPVLGEFSDLVWAPLSGFIFYRLFGGRMGALGGMLNMAEELLPFTDLVPSFSIAWVLKYFYRSKNRLSVQVTR